MCLSRIAGKIPGEAKLTSATRRLNRLLDNPAIRVREWLVNLLRITEAGELIEPAKVATYEAGSRFVFTISVNDVDEMCAELFERGVKLLNGPVDRPWGIRTASFMDPAGYIWEIA